MMNATYSPDDNKLRLYSTFRLDAETYAKVKAEGFKWAPQQQLFVAPMWTPGREDLLIELCGEIEDEDKRLVDRAEERAERFDDYSEKRKADADRAHAAVSAIADNIPMGQPILVGHHSEKHARRDAEKIENGMRRAVKMWETSQYWTRRAAGALRHAKYKERADVRARRIKGLEADKRKHERTVKASNALLSLWSELDNPHKDGRPCDDDLRMKRALWIAARAHYYQPDGVWSLYSALSDGKMTAQEAREIAERQDRGNLQDAQRWLTHLENRLAYEKAMLDDQGASALLAPKPKAKQLPLCNYRQEVFSLPNRYSRGELIHYHQVEMTQAEYSAIHNDYKGTRIVENSHRIRTALVKQALVAVFLTDSKVHEKPAAIEPELPPPPKPRTPALSEPKPIDQDKAKFQALQEQLKTGVHVVAANQLFPTPADVAERMVDYADIKPGHRVLEPSAGKGDILAAVGRVRIDCKAVAVEINHSLSEHLKATFIVNVETRCADFLSCNGDLGTFDRILMNPPFENGADIKHITHALHMLKPGGRLVAICADGPRQNDALRPLASEWEPLPAGTFKDQGTNVNTVLMVIDKG